MKLQMENHVLMYNAFRFILNSNGSLIWAHVITLHDTYTHLGIHDPSKIYFIETHNGTYLVHLSYNLDLKRDYLHAMYL